MNNIGLIGCGGHARSVADVILNNDPQNKITFIDKNARINEKILDFNVLKKIPDNIKSIHISIGDNIQRKIFFEKYQNKIVSIISKNAYVGKSSIIKSGCFVGHNVFIGPEANIGKGTIVNTSCIIEHEVIIGNFCHIAPNSTICGRTKIGDNVLVGAGSTIIDKISICDNVIIGANSCVVKDIIEPGSYVGTPLRKIK